MTLATRQAEIEPTLQRHFEVFDCSDPRHPEHEYEIDRNYAFCFEFDYPDRPGLQLLCSTKEKYPQIPLIMVTAQHSEQLAVWAYRNRVLDYFVKPILEDDLKRCLDIIGKLQQVDGTQNPRPIINMQSKIPSDIPSGQRDHDVRLEPAIRYVEANFRRRIRNRDVADCCDMSPYHFSHAFTATFSMTFQEFVLRYRVLQSCRELLHPNIAVANVAYSVGFNDPSYFSRVFRRYIGCAPSQFCRHTEDGLTKTRLTDVFDKLELPELASAGFDRRAESRGETALERFRG